MLERGLVGRGLGQCRENAFELEREPAQHRVRERDGALEAGAADELDRLVHRRVARYRIEVAKLVGAEPQRRPHRCIELRDGSPADRLERVVERADALHGAEGDSLRERAVPSVEALGRAAEHAVGVGLLLEDAAHDLVGRDARGRDAHRSPRRNSS